MVAASPTPAPKIATPPRKPPKAVKAPKLAAKYYATGYPGEGSPLPPKFVEAVHAVELALGSPAWLLIQDPPDQDHLQSPPYHSIDEATYRAFLSLKPHLPKARPIPLIIDSPGGSARSAYRIANLLRQHCGGFVAIVPEYAKSAATLLTLGADQIILCPHAEIGPLDTQVFDPDREGFGSALDEVQALDRLNAFALQAVDAGVILFASRSGKSLDKLLPQVLHFVSEMVRPLFEKIDTVHYTLFA